MDGHFHDGPVADGGGAFSRQSSKDPFDLVSMDGLDQPPWMFGTDEVSWPSPKRTVASPMQHPPGPEEFDNVVRKVMVDNLTERVHLQKRIDVVHHGGQPEATESCNVLLRAMWAMPFVVFAQGVKLASRPLVGCCSPGARVPADKLQAGQGTDPLSPKAPGGDEKAEKGPNLLGVLSAAEITSSGGLAPKPKSQRSRPGSLTPSLRDEAPTQAAAQPPPEAKAPELAPAEPPPEAKASPQPAPAGQQRRSRPNANASVLSVSSNVQSSAGALLGAYAGGRPKKDGSSKASGAASVIAEDPIRGGAGPLRAGGSPGRSSSSGRQAEAPPPKATPAAAPAATPAAAPAAAPAGAPAAAPAAKPAPAPAASAAGPSSADAGSKSKAKSRSGGGESKTVVSNFQSGSAASNLLGPMVANAGKKKRAPGDAASAIG